MLSIPRTGRLGVVLEGTDSLPALLVLVMPVSIDVYGRRRWLALAIAVPVVVSSVPVVPSSVIPTVVSSVVPPGIPTVFFSVSRVVVPAVHFAKRTYVEFNVHYRDW